MTTKYIIQFEHLTAKLTAKELIFLKARFAPITYKDLDSKTPWDSFRALRHKMLDVGKEQIYAQCPVQPREPSWREE